mmetsp:Transcript_2446/g.6091  ORF Transcript_2446/g.6091 Transcript_2446/m.6091 type:complete len:399 (-) Transcript_2446:161-1357(-)
MHGQAPHLRAHMRTPLSELVDIVPAGLLKTAPRDPPSSRSVETHLASESVARFALVHGQPLAAQQRHPEVRVDVEDLVGSGPVSSPCPQLVQQDIDLVVGLLKHGQIHVVVATAARPGAARIRLRIADQALQPREVLLQLQQLIFGHPRTASTATRGQLDRQDSENLLQRLPSRIRRNLATTSVRQAEQHRDVARRHLGEVLPPHAGEQVGLEDVPHGPVQTDGLPVVGVHGTGLPEVLDLLQGRHPENHGGLLSEHELVGAVLPVHSETEGTAREGLPVLGNHGHPARLRAIVALRLNVHLGQCAQQDRRWAGRRAGVGPQAGQRAGIQLDDWNAESSASMSASLSWHALNPSGGVSSPCLRIFSLAAASSPLTCSFSSSMRRLLACRSTIAALSKD